ncbi:MAG: hypothetical protein RMJ66_05910 [Bacteroidia bacterium]|nr:DUF2490 domain-containing protein [Bacteroidia bacterium]MDW8134585.1 hypothetical protein [Bacteroidia bacterium]
MRISTLIGLLYLQGALVVAQAPRGIWTFQQINLSLDRKEIYQLILNTQPRFVRQGWESVVITLAFSKRLGASHVASVGGVWARSYFPSAFYQTRLVERWQYMPYSWLLFSGTLEQRWQNGAYWEGLMRPLIRYRISVGRVWVGFTNEFFLTHWSPVRRWHLYLRQNRFLVALSFPQQASWQVEMGYLNIAVPRSFPRHRLWLGVRLNLLLSRLSLRGNDKADRGDGAQNLPTELPPESPSQ